MIIHVKICDCGPVKITAFKYPAKMRCNICRVEFTLEKQGSGEYSIHVFQVVVSKFGTNVLGCDKKLPNRKKKKKAKEVKSDFKAIEA